MVSNIGDVLNKALEFKNSERYDEAISYLRDFESQFIQNGKYLQLLSALYFLNKDYINSAKFFRVYTELKPDSEDGSVGLFQSLWNKGDFDESYIELDRFLSTHNPIRTYLTILEEHHSLLNESTPDFERKIIIKYFDRYLSRN